MNIETVTWRLIPSGLPAVIRHCPHCGRSARYECSHAFRINANQNLLDVWLIYLCQNCGHTWNMDILSRVEARSINKNLYQKDIRQRNAEIYRSFLKGKTAEELAEEYYLSIKSIHRVLLQEKRKLPD